MIMLMMMNDSLPVSGSDVFKLTYDYSRNHELDEQNIDIGF